jgi:quercetin dioxygenase-like cupin family protein
MQRDAGRSTIHLPGEGRAIDMGAFRMIVKADENDTGGAFSLLEAAEPPGFGPPLHTHEDAGEAFYVLEGEYLILLDDQEYLCPAGSFVFIPAGRVHGFRVGNVPSRKLNIYSPAAMVGYFDDLERAAAASATLDDESLVAMAARHHMRVLGPVPEGYS